MTNAPTPQAREPRLEGDELVTPEPEEAVPDRLDRPIEVPEADALDQRRGVPIDDEEQQR